MALMGYVHNHRVLVDKPLGLLVTPSYSQLPTCTVKVHFQIEPHQKRGLGRTFRREQTPCVTDL